MTGKATLAGNRRQQLLAAIARPIQPIEVTGSYRMRMFLAGAAAIAIVILYLAIILGAAWLSFVILTGGLFGSGGKMTGGRAMLMWFMINRAGPAFACFCVVIALVKPLFAARDDDEDEAVVELNPAREPLLFEFVRLLCKAVGAPAPAVIAVDPHVNASASFVEGPLDGRLRLTIGLPLVFGLNMRQLAGVMAHEFGHFSQRTGMRMTWLIRTIIQWLGRAAWERDRWDAWLESMSSEMDLRLGWIFFLARGIVWVARQIIKGLFLLAMLFCSRLMQEMEFDADRHEARLAGCRSFATTCRQLQLLNLSHSGALSDLDRFRREGRLPDNLPKLVVANVPLIPTEVASKLHALMLKAETGRFDTHPADRDRIRNAAAEKTDGTFRVELPAQLLLADPDGLSRQVTKKLYEQAFGGPEGLRQLRLQRTEELVEEVNQQSDDQTAGQAFLLNQYSHYRSFLPARTPSPPVSSLSEFRTRTARRREALARRVVAHATLREQGQDFGDELRGAIAAMRLIDAGVARDENGKALSAKDKAGVRELLQKLARREEDRFRRLEPFRRLMGDRLADALELAKAEQVRQRLGSDAESPETLSQILACWETIQQNDGFWDRLIVECQYTQDLLRLAESNSDAGLGKLFEDQAKRFYRLLQILRNECNQLAYPFKHAQGQVSLGAYLLPRMPDPGNPSEVISAGLEAGSSFGMFVHRSAMRMAALAGKVEKLAGFDPIPLPAELQDMDEESLDEVLAG